MATLAQEPVRSISFWQRMALGLALFIVFGFAQFAARGYVDVARVPVWVHLHGVAMLGWLGLLVVQPSLIRSGKPGLHRQLGWAGAGLAAVIVGLGSYSGLMAVASGRVPPFFTAPYFLALTQLGIAAFAGLVIAAVLRRGQLDWHRRLMLGATILILEPALGRVLPMPLLGMWGEWAVMLVQLGVLGIVARHDRKMLGAVHPATTSVAVVIALTHVLIELLARMAPTEALAVRIAGG